MPKKRSDDDCLSDMVRYVVVSVDGICFAHGEGQGFSLHGEDVLTEAFLRDSVGRALDVADYDQELKFEDEPVRVLIMTVQVALYRLPIERKGEKPCQ